MATQKKERAKLTLIGQAIRAERHRQGRTLADVAEKTGLTVSLLSQIELGKTVPSLMSLRLIAKGLNISMFSLLSYLEADSRVVRRDERKTFDRPGFAARFELLAPDVSGYMEPVMMTLEPGNSSCEEPLCHQGDEWIMVVEGEIQAELNGTHYTLEEGDTLYLDASTFPHRYTNTSCRAARAVVVMSPPSW